MRTNRSNNRRSRAAMTLVELLLSLVIGGIMLMAVSYLVTFVNSQITVYSERFAMYSQINFALEDMRTRMPPAVKILTPLTYAISSRSSFKFEADQNIYNVTPDTLTDNVYYHYAVVAGKGLVLDTLNKTTSALLSRNILVEEKYNPEINFTRQDADEPDILTIILGAKSSHAARMTAHGLSQYVAKVEGVKFWLIDVKQ